MENMDFEFAWVMSEGSKVNEGGCAVTVARVAAACLYARAAINGISRESDVANNVILTFSCLVEFLLRRCLLYIHIIVAPIQK